MTSLWCHDRIICIIMYYWCIILYQKLRKTKRRSIFELLSGLYILYRRYCLNPQGKSQMTPCVRLYGNLISQISSCPPQAETEMAPLMMMFGVADVIDVSCSDRPETFSGSDRVVNVLFTTVDSPLGIIVWILKPGSLRAPLKICVYVKNSNQTKLFPKTKYIKITVH